MLSTSAIDDAAAFTELVNIAKSALEGKNVSVTKKEEKKVETKEKNEKKTDEKDYSKMTVAELKNIAKEKGIEGYTAMKKAELLEAIK